MKAIFYTLIILVALFLYSRFGPPLPISVSSVVTNKDSLFTVTGEGKTSMIPDEANITLGMQVTSKTVADGQAQVNTTINSLVEKLKGMGVEKKDIKTENYNVNPSYDNANHITGYSINTNLVITIHDLAKVNNIIDTATATGLNNVGGIEFTLSDSKKDMAMDEARQQAITQAKAKAANIAKISGIRLGKIINVEENSDQTIRPLMMAAGKSASDAANEQTQIQPGSTDVSLNVTLSYETY